MERKDIHQVIGIFIYKERKKQKLSMAQLSMKAHGTLGHASRIGKIEKGELKGCTVTTISEILKGLGYDMRQLFRK